MFKERKEREREGDIMSYTLPDGHLPHTHTHTQGTLLVESVLVHLSFYN